MYKPEGTVGVAKPEGKVTSLTCLESIKKARAASRLREAENGLRQGLDSVRPHRS